MNNNIKMGALSHIGIRVSNMMTSLRFYEEVLGFKTFKEIKMSGDEVKDMIGGLTCDGVHLVLGWVGKVCIELVEYSGVATKPRSLAVNDIPPLPDFGPHHFGLVVNNVDEMFKHCTAIGARCLSGVLQKHGNKIFMILDPDGTRIHFSAVPAGELFAANQK
jgi:catechol 2,3-dioxygenase-like lactoylglutathione lyase family enzyme